MKQNRNVYFHRNCALISGNEGKLIHKCQCCPQYFASVQEMEQHKSDQHAEILTCNVCQKRFKDPESLHNHVKFVHGKQKKTKTYQMCPKCGKCETKCSNQFMSLIAFHFQAKNLPAIMRCPTTKIQIVADRRTTNVMFAVNFIIAPAR